MDDNEIIKYDSFTFFNSLSGRNMFYRYDIEKNEMITTKVFDELKRTYFKYLVANPNNRTDFISKFENAIYRAIVVLGVVNFESYYYNDINIMRHYTVSGRYNLDNHCIEGYIVDTSNSKFIEEQVLLWDKLRNLGTLAGSIAHDFKNHLMVIMGSAQLLERVDSKEQKEKYLESIYSSVEKAKELVDGIMQHGNIQTANLNINIIQCLKNALVLIKHSNNKAYEVYENHVSEEILIEGNHGFMQNAFMNIIKNAVEALGKEGVICINSDIISLEQKPEDVVYADDFSAGKYVQIKISDNGSGMNKEILDNIFKPFFTTKIQQKGTGLGLPNVLETVKRHQGILCVKSKRNQGTTFTLYFKVIGESETLKEKTECDLKRILVIDNDPLVTMILHDILEELGYNPVVFNDIPAAIEYYSKNFQEVDLVFCDMMIPKFSAKDIFNNLKMINDKMKFVLISGFSDEHIDKELKTMIDAFLEKPIMVSLLDQTIKDLINSK